MVRFIYSLKAMQEPNYGIKNDNAIIMIHTINSKDIQALVLPMALHGKI